MKRIIFKRKLDHILSKGSGEQLWWLLAITCIIIGCATLIGVEAFGYSKENIMNAFAVRLRELFRPSFSSIC